MVKQKRKSDKGAFKYRRAIALCCQCAIPSKAPFPLIERKFPKTFHLEQQNSLFFREKNTNGSRWLRHNNDRRQLSTDIFLTNFATTSPGPRYPAAEICSQSQYVWLTQCDWVALAVTAWRSWSTCKHEMSRLRQKINDKMTSLHLHHRYKGKKNKTKGIKWEIKFHFWLVRKNEIFQPMTQLQPTTWWFVLESTLTSNQSLSNWSRNISPTSPTTTYI